MKNISIFRTFLAVSIFAAFSFSIAFSQNYRIKGIVLDKETGDPLPGATVTLEGTRYGAVTNKEGKFIIDNIDYRKITLKVTYIGYKPLSLEHNFLEKRNPEYTLELITDAAQMDEVEVIGESQGQVKAFIEQKRAVNIKNVVSAEQIEEFPDLNAAEAMQRIPGITLQRDQGEGRYVQLRGTPPELTNFNINGEQIPSPEGDVRYVGMDIISADQIEFIEVSKVLTPDMDADGIGGTVNIITKKAATLVPKINATIAGGYNNLRSSDNYQAQFAYGQRYEKFGFNVNGSYYVNNQGSDNMEFKYLKSTFITDTGKENYHVQYREAELRHYDITRARTGISTTLDYQFNPNHTVYLRAMYNSFTDEEIRRRKIYTLDDAFTYNFYDYGGIEHDVRERLQEQEISTLNIGGEHKYFGIELDYEGAYGYATEKMPDYLEARFENWGQAIDIKFDMSDPDYPKATFPTPEDAIYADDYDKYEFEALIFEDAVIKDRNLTGKINFKIPYSLNGDNEGYIKFGSKVRSKNKSRDVTATEYSAYIPKSKTYPGEGPELVLTTVSGDFSDNNLLDHGYVVDYMPDPELMHSFFKHYQEFFIIQRTDSKMRTYAEDYQAYEDIYAGYLMARHDIGNLMLLGGIRYEVTNIEYEGRHVITNERGKFQDIDTLKDKRTHEFILPQFQTKYTINDNFNLRAAITYSYARPNFEDVIPYREQDREEVKYGNPDLKFPSSMNIDLLAERYFLNGGLLQGGLFYKKIDDFIFYYKRFAHEGEDVSAYGLVEIEQAVNGIEAFVYGAEVQVQYKLDFLPGFFADFGIYSNYTFTHSEAFIGERIPANNADAVVIFNDENFQLYDATGDREKVTLPGQAKHAANIALFFENENIYAKLSANFHDAFLYELGADKDLDVFYDESWHLDFTANYSITPNLKVFVDVINLTNAPLKFYLGKPSQIMQQEFYSWWGRLGLKLSI